MQDSELECRIIGNNKYWFKSGTNIRHRIYGPAIERADGGKAWLQNDYFHRENGPAIINNRGDEKWYRRGKLHRKDGPAIIENGKYGQSYSWYFHGKKHCKNGPAEQKFFQKGVGAEKVLSWWFNGKPHRKDGPAFIYGEDGNPENMGWSYKGEDIICSSTEEFVRILKMKVDKEICTIYLLRNTHPDGQNKIYVGQTWRTLSKRMGPEGKNYNNCAYLYSAIEKYGSKYFIYETLAECETQEEADKLEDEFILKYNSINENIGYNLRLGGSNGKHSDSTKEKMSKNNARFFLGKSMPQETKDKISAANAGKTFTDEWKENNSIFMKERHATQGHPMQGKNHTEEAKQKISLANKGRKIDSEIVSSRALARRDIDNEIKICEYYKKDGTGVISKEMKDYFKSSATQLTRILKKYGLR